MDRLLTQVEEKRLPRKNKRALRESLRVVASPLSAHLLTLVLFLFIMIDTALSVNNLVEYFPLSLSNGSRLFQKSNPDEVYIG